jgi:hypothetical protein
MPLAVSSVTWNENDPQHAQQHAHFLQPNPARVPETLEAVNGYIAQLMALR